MRKTFLRFAVFLCLLEACPFAVQAAETPASALSIPGLTYDHSLSLSYASCFSADYYTDGYVLITIKDEGQFLLVPENHEVPDGLDESIGILKQPLEHIYLAATSAMDLFRAIDGLGSLRLSGTKEDGWYVQEAKDAMEAGSLIYAGKYSAPDYELILSEDCDLAIESTMIHHNPEVQEKLETLGIPVLVERSSYESHPLGRTEWMKLYAVLLGKEEAAEAAFQEQADRLDAVLSSEDSAAGKTVAFFYINSSGAVNVRKSNDYVSKMISLAGGTYVPENTGESDNALSTMNMQMEEFYAKAKDADVIIYNSTIDGELSTLEELLGKNELLADFKAVQNGSVWCTGKNLFQETTGLGAMIEEIHTILTSEDENLKELTYFHRLR